MKSRVHPTQAVAECRWSVPAFHPSLMSDDDDTFEGYWLCERTSLALPVTQAGTAPSARPGLPSWLLSGPISISASGFVQGRPSL